MNFDVRNLFFDIEVIKEKLDDLATSHSWFVDDTFTSDTLQNIEEVKHYGLAYSEHRIHNNQIVDLMLMYLKELDCKITYFNKLCEQEKSALSHADQSEDSTHN
ncbi:DUF1474 family protein [Staphylococcus saprophyticus]|uniref:type II toxin-antitoxin system toxin TscT n=1 Tax=Staphylococcus saprophyticus TaxID=29385 RepID=UPI0034DD2D04